MGDSLIELQHALGPAPAPGFIHVDAGRIREMLQAQSSNALDDWPAFAQSWNGMPRDQHMADGGRYRYRRHAVLRSETGSPAWQIEPHQPHYQSRDYNALNGGIERWYDPIAANVIESATFNAVLSLGRAVFERLSPAIHWRIEAHQFRIQASAESAGLPTPEGVHRDGVDYVLVLLVARSNIASGTTTIHAPDGRVLDRFTLTQPLDCALLDDHRCLHGVTPVVPLDLAQAAYRDVLVLTWTHTS